MAHFVYARSGAVIYRFNSRPAREAWVAEHPASRTAISADEVPFRLKTGRPVPGLELRDGPDLAQPG